jgi:mRNA-degrading endonuclease YafQ of YafQ-DinJ toxin-antitoxin module
MRVGLDLRLIFKVERDAITFVFAGTHDEVRRFLKQL